MSSVNHLENNVTGENPLAKKPISAELFRKLINQPQGLYNPAMEHANCGVGFIANIKGQKSHDIITKALELNCKIEHRGAVGADPKTGDGAGILIQMPDDFFRRIAVEEGFELPEYGRYGVGFLFLPRDKRKRQAVVNIIEKVIYDEDQEVIGWRKVPVDESLPGEGAKITMPFFMQCFIKADVAIENQDEFERKLYLLRRVIDHRIRAEMNLSRDEYYVTSFSSRVLVYKGMLLADQFQKFYKDFEADDLKSAIALLHMRFSTNTFPSWNLAQPFRYVAHNGEINTLKGNQNWMTTRQAVMESPYFGKDIKRMLPIYLEGQSDSATFDLVLELLVMSGRSLPHAVMMMIPEAWSKNEQMNPELKAFYEYHAMLMEPWDGPAAMAFTDGRVIGATLDRNGLRPARYFITKNNMAIMASELGGIDVPADEIIESGKLQPGKMFLIDTVAGRIVPDEEIKKQISRQRPYKKWVEDNILRLDDLPDTAGTPLRDRSRVLERQRIFGYTKESINMVILPMVANGEEAVGSMGIDAALAVLSKRPQVLFRYFKQLFAQVTNPPVDAIREELVMELTTYIGPEGNLLDETPEHAHRLELEHPVISNQELAKLKKISEGNFKSASFSLLFDANKKHDMRNQLDRICEEATELVKSGTNLLILSDRGINKDHAAIPSLLAVAGVHHHLIRKGLRTKTGIVIETGEAYEVFHFSLLCGYGANAINPYLAFEIIQEFVEDKKIETANSFDKAKSNYLKAIKKGLFKIFSKMGISTLQSYCGAQIFEAVGLDSEIIRNYFTGTPSQIEGLSLEMLEKETILRHHDAYSRSTFMNSEQLDSGGVFHYRTDGEQHLWNPLSIAKLQQATRENNYNLYKEYSKLINDQSGSNVTLRSLFHFETDRKPVNIKEVEPIESILKRFATGAMSYGSISWEAHTSLAIAMNRIGGKSNTGEGGEDPIRFKPLSNGDSMRSAIKQVASGRFGVTSNYLTNADELQIKISQGAKPGEGGQLPGIKVDKIIAKVRHSTPGVTLISPPPHHDIYSIEDLKQLIFDLKNSNPNARISVKLVSEIGVGTVAAGVAKAHADHIVIAGHDGGTGASPISSIHYAGTPWELGLSEAHQTLVVNGLRDRVYLQVDGQIKTGRDVIIGALMGAEEFGFATTALVTQGCIMMRKCHLNTCPVGVATQDPELRKKYTGKPEYVVNFMKFVAEEVRELMAELGFKKFTDMIGYTEALKFDKPKDNWKAKSLDFSKIIYQPTALFETDLYRTKSQNHAIDAQLDNVFIKKAKDAIEKSRPVVIDAEVRSSNRTIGTLLSHHVTLKHGENGLPDGCIKLNLTGTAGQSFGAFVTKGVELNLVGFANDYVGKGLSGGRIIVVVPDGVTYEPSKNFIVGNVCLYGATSGEAFINGRAGERFAIRNSGVNAVIEGVGDHACEYMTGGKVVVLGATGRNFGAGMSGGVAIIWDPDNTFNQYLNKDMVEVQKLTQSEYEDDALLLIEKHKKHTNSKRASYILSNWESEKEKFKLVIPVEYKIALEKIRAEENGRSDIEQSAVSKSVAV